MNCLLLARADQTGLGIQTYEFYKALNPETVVIDMSPLNYLPTNYNLFPNSHVVKIRGYDHLGRDISGLIARADILFTCETPYDYEVFNIARLYNTKTVLQYNYELFDYLREPHLPQPDLFAAPSLWNYDKVPYPNKTFLPVPVNREALPFKVRTQAKRFLHVAGNPTIDDRNGTQIVIQAMQFLQGEDITLDIIAPFNNNNFNIDDPRIKILPAKDNYWELYKDYDVLVMPRKYGGLSLPLQEASSCGLPVIITDISPQNNILPKDCLVPISYSKDILCKVMVESYETMPHTVAEYMRKFIYNPTLVKELSLWANDWAESISWTVMKEKYLDTFKDLIK